MKQGVRGVSAFYDGNGSMGESGSGISAAVERVGEMQETGRKSVALFRKICYNTLYLQQSKIGRGPRAKPDLR